MKRSCTEFFDDDDNDDDGDDDGMMFESHDRRNEWMFWRILVHIL